MTAPSPFALVTPAQLAVMQITGAGTASYREAGNWLGISRPAAKQRAYRGRKRARARMTIGATINLTNFAVSSGAVPGGVS